MDFDTNDSINPDLDDLLQEDEDQELAVAVRHKGPVHAQLLPARIAYSRNINVTDAADPAMLEIVASEDLRRQYIAILCTGNPVYIGHERQHVIQGTSGILPVGIVLYLTTSAEIWVRSTVAGGSAVSYWSGNWAD